MIHAVVFYISPVRKQESIFLPGCYADGINGSRHKRFHICRCQTRIGKQRDIVVDCVTAYAITVGQLALCMILRYIYHQVDSMVADNIKHGLSLLIGPAYLVWRLTPLDARKAAVPGVA